VKQLSACQSLRLKTQTRSEHPAVPPQLHRITPPDFAQKLHEARHNNCTISAMQAKTLLIVRISVACAADTMAFLYLGLLRLTTLVAETTNKMAILCRS
jgi:hypothetical protein